MPTVADALRQHVPAYYAKFGERVPLGHRKVLDLITRCRTGELGGVLYQCQSCQHEHWVGRSCGNRHCPNCGSHKTAEWLAKQSKKMLPVHHFLVTFTVPEELRPLLRAHQPIGYRELFRCGSQTILDVAGSTKSLKDCRLGFFGVLHTWGRDPLVFHPHVHFVVPGGGVNEDRSAWCSTPTNFFLHHGTLIQVYKAKFADAMRDAKLYDEIPAEAWNGKWVVDVHPVGDGQAVLKYLAPYVHRVAISNNRILACDEDSVTYRYTPSGTKVSKTRRVTGEQFVHGFTQHILPSGFQKVHHYGWMSANCGLKFEEVKWLVWLFLGWTFWLASVFGRPSEPPPSPKMRCARCGGQMFAICVIVNVPITPGPVSRALPEHSVSYLDSG